MTRTLALALLLALGALACSPPSGDQLAESFTKGCLRGCAQTTNGSLDCNAYCDCATSKIREHRTDAEFSEFIVSASYHPTTEVTSEIERTARQCIHEVRR